MLKLTESRNLNRIPKEYPRMAIGTIMSESYRLLYECQNPKVKKLIEAHIRDMKTLSSSEVQSNLSKLSENTNVLRNMVRLGRRVRISESELAQTNPDEEIRDESRTEDTEEMEDRDLLDTQPKADAPATNLKPVIKEDDPDLLEAKKVAKKKKSCTESLEEVDKQKIRRGRINPGAMSHVKEIKDCDNPRKIKESSWSDHRYKMIPALKNFRESSNNKAFYKTLSRMGESLHKGTNLSVKESITLYKAVNSAMTHLAVELEHNPGFIYTFNECVSLLSRDTANLLSYIKEGKSPSRGLLRSIGNFASILMNEEEDYDADLDIELDVPEEEETAEEGGIPADSVVVTPEGEEIPFEDIEIKDLDVGVDDIKDFVNSEVEDAGLSDEAEQTDLSSVSEEEAEELANYLVALRKGDDGSEPEEEESPEETPEEDEISDEEFESLKVKLGEMRRIRKVRESKRSPRIKSLKESFNIFDGDRVTVDADLQYSRDGSKEYYNIKMYYPSSQTVETITSRVMSLEDVESIKDDVESIARRIDQSDSEYEIRQDLKKLKSMLESTGKIVRESRGVRASEPIGESKKPALRRGKK